jgi:hypothetical protein
MPAWPCCCLWAGPPNTDVPNPPQFGRQGVSDACLPLLLPVGRSLLLPPTPPPRTPQMRPIHQNMPLLLLLLPAPSSQPHRRA